MKRTDDWKSDQVYEIRLRGHLDRSRAHLFEGLEMAQEPNGETVLTGPIVDQAALHGVLNRICDLGLPLLSVNQIEPGQMNSKKVDAQ